LEKARFIIASDGEHIGQAGDLENGGSVTAFCRIKIPVAGRPCAGQASDPHLDKQLPFRSRIMAGHCFFRCRPLTKESNCPSMGKYSCRSGWRP